MKKQILIIGGTGKMGQFFIPIFKKHEFSVLIWGKSGRRDIAEKMGVEFAEDLDFAIKKSDIVIISVPIDKTESTIKECAPKMKKGSLLMDFTSLKVKPIQTMLKFAPMGVEVIGTHPMFGHSIPSMEGQIVILAPTDRCNEWFPIINSIFEKEGAHIEIMDAALHDEFTSIIQGLTHFAYIAIGTTFKRLDFNISESKRFMSPVYDILIDFVGRILGQNPYLYASIQMENPNIKIVHESFIAECKELSEIVTQQDMNSFIKKMRSASQHFGDTSGSQRRSDELINLKQNKIDTLINLIGKEIGLYHVHSKITHIGKLEQVNSKQIIISKNNKSISFKMENVRLLSNNELRAWKINHLTHKIRDISVWIPNGADAQVILNIISLDERLEFVKIKDKYCLNEKISITYRLNIIDEQDIEKVVEKVEQLLVGIGCEIRTKS
ncbi:MAG: prephenate dehydrogenase [Methanosarcinales archaeon]|nr:prephenate dehydrogenase [Methanosarcinales archaeon]